MLYCSLREARHTSAIFMTAISMCAFFADYNVYPQTKKIKQYLSANVGDC